MQDIHEILKKPLDELTQEEADILNRENRKDMQAWIERQEELELKKDTETREVMERLVEGVGEDFWIYEISGIQIKIKKFLPHRLRSKILETQKTVKGFQDNFDSRELKQIHDTAYEIMSEVCVEHPWTKQEAWRVIDRETGAVPTLMTEIISKLEKQQERVGSFRGRRRRAAAPRDG